jgi:hypothetical protein
MIACLLPVIPPKCTGVPITQPEKIIELSGFIAIGEDLLEE